MSISHLLDGSFRSNGLPVDLTNAACAFHDFKPAGTLDTPITTQGVYEELVYQSALTPSIALDFSLSVDGILTYDGDSKALFIISASLYESIGKLYSFAFEREETAGFDTLGESIAVGEGHVSTSAIVSLLPGQRLRLIAANQEDAIDLRFLAVQCVIRRL